MVGRLTKWIAGEAWWIVSLCLIGLAIVLVANQPPLGQPAFGDEQCSEECGADCFCCGGACHCEGDPGE